MRNVVCAAPLVFLPPALPIEARQLHLSTAPVPQRAAPVPIAPPLSPPSQSTPPSVKARAALAGPMVEGDFPFPNYLRQLQNKITEKMVLPRGAVVGGEAAIIVFEIEREGQVREPSVERS